MKVVKTYSNVHIEITKNDSGDYALYISGDYGEPLAEYTLRDYKGEE